MNDDNSWEDDDHEEDEDDAEDTDSHFKYVLEATNDLTVETVTAAYQSGDPITIHVSGIIDGESITDEEIVGTIRAMLLIDGKREFTLVIQSISFLDRLTVHDEPASLAGVLFKGRFEPEIGKVKIFIDPRSTPRHHSVQEYDSLTPEDVESAIRVLPKKVRAWVKTIVDSKPGGGVFVMIGTAHGGVQLQKDRDSDSWEISVSMPDPESPTD